MKRYLEKYHAPFGIIGGVVALIIAVIYLNVTPSEAVDVAGIQKIILIYGHSLCWVLLGAASVLWAVKKGNKLSGVLAYSALAVYVLFMSTLLITKFA